MTALSSQAEGSYLVFTLENGGRFCVRETRESPLRWILPAAIGALILLLVILLAVLHHKRKNRPAAGSEPAAAANKEGSAE